MAPHILVIEDDLKIQEIVRDFFIREGYQVTLAKDGIEGVYLFEHSTPKPDLLIVDVMMPDLDGWQVCQRIRRNSRVPILILTAKGDEQDELMAFDLMADDFMKKPFSPSVLVARSKALLNKYNQRDVLCFNEMEIDKTSRTLRIHAKSIELTSKEFDIIWYLANRPGQAISRDMLLNEVWGYDFIGDQRIVDTHIKKIRHALGDYAFKIATVFGVGYKFEVRE